MKATPRIQLVGNSRSRSTALLEGFYREDLQPAQLCRTKARSLSESGNTECPSTLCCGRLTKETTRDLSGRSEQREQCPTPQW